MGTHTTISITREQAIQYILTHLQELSNELLEDIMDSLYYTELDQQRSAEIITGDKT